MFIPIYTSNEPSRWGFAFHPHPVEQEPACWAWVPDGSALTTDQGVEMIHEPGRRSLRFAHELYFETENRQDLPIRLGPSSKPPGGPVVT